MRWPVWLGIGFRPWFLVLLATGAGLFALWGATWLAAANGLSLWQAPLASPGDWRWHAHEMLFGLGVGLLSGFLLTAVQNWTGSRPLGPRGLLLSVLLWLLARLVLLADLQGWAGYILSALPAILVGGAILRVIIRARQWRNLLFPLALFLLAGLDLYFGGRIDGSDLQTRVAWLALWPLLAVVLFIAQRILPAFTAGRAGVPPRPLGRTAALLFGAGPLILLWLACWPDFPLRTVLMAVFGGGLVLAGLRGLWCWYHPIIWREPMLLVLHGGYLLVLLGLTLFVGYWLAESVGTAQPLWLDAAVHGLGLGILGVIGPGMLLRVSAGHTGRPIVMSRWLRAFFVLAVTAWLARLAVLVLGFNPWLLGMSAWAMAAVYLALLLAIGGWLLRPRADQFAWRPG